MVILAFAMHLVAIFAFHYILCPSKKKDKSSQHQQIMQGK